MLSVFSPRLLQYRWEVVAIHPGVCRYPRPGCCFPARKCFYSIYKLLHHTLLMLLRNKALVSQVHTGRLASFVCIYAGYVAIHAGVVVIHPGVCRYPRPSCRFTRQSCRIPSPSSPSHKKRSPAIKASSLTYYLNKIPL